MKRLIALVVVVAAGVVAAAFTLPDNAATVNGQSISQSALNSDLAAISSSPEYQCLLDAQVVVRSNGAASLPPISGVGRGTYNTTFVDYWLTQMIDNVLVSQLAARRHPTLTASEMAIAHRELLQSIRSTLNGVAGTRYECAVQPVAVLSSLPQSFVQELVRAQAYNDALLSESPGSGVSEAELRAYFAEHRSEFDTLCVSGILVASQSTAAQLRAQIQAGASFAQVASANSLDTASAARGGALGCFAATSSSYASVLQDVGSLTLGQVSQPLASTQGGYVLLEVTSRTTPAFASVRDVVRRVVLAGGQKQATAVLTRAARRSPVQIDPRYGRWNPAQVIRGVLAPLHPLPSTVLNPGASVPTFATAASGGSTG